MQSLSWAHAAAVAAGAVLGAWGRWLTGVWVQTAWPGFPLGTLLVNCLGGFLIGAALVWFSRHPDEFWRLLLVTGFLGAFTTFSSFSLESLQLLQRQDWGLALAHTAAHVMGSLACTLLGWAAARSVWA